MVKLLVDEVLWERIEPLLPVVERRYRYPGRKRIPDRRALPGILFVLKTGIAWEDRPARRDGLRIRHDLLATPARLERRRRVDAPAPGAAGRVARGR